MKEKRRESLVNLERDDSELPDEGRENSETAIMTASSTVMTAEDEDQLASLATRARAANKRGVELILEIKQILAEAYELHHRIGCGSTFGTWVAENLPDLSQRTVERYMKIHKVFGDATADTLSRFDVTALYLLSEEKVSLTSRQMALLIAKGGGRITAAAARQFATNPWDHDSNGAPSRKNVPVRTPKPVPITVSGGEVIVKLLTDQVSVAAALEEALQSLQTRAD